MITCDKEQIDWTKQALDAWLPYPNRIRASAWYRELFVYRAYRPRCCRETVK